MISQLQHFNVVHSLPEVVEMALYFSRESMAWRGEVGIVVVEEGTGV